MKSHAPTSTELLPCLHCGGTNLSTDAYSVQPDNFHSAYIECGDCEARGPNALTVDGWLSSKEEAISEAIAAWNLRAPAQEQAKPHDTDCPARSGSPCVCYVGEQAKPSEADSSSAAPSDHSMPLDMAQARRWIFQLRTRVDSLLDIINATSPTVAAPSDALLKAIIEVVGCFEAAQAEGLEEALVDTTDDRLRDLVERRLMYALHAAQPFAPRVFRDGDAICAVWPDFIDLQISPAGFGDTKEDAINKLLAALAAPTGASQSAVPVERFSIYEDHGRANMIGDDDGEYVLYSDYAAALATPPAAMPAQASDPVAWAVFAPDGNCRIWFGDIEAARRWKAGYEPTLSSELTPLYTHPATSQSADQVQELSALPELPTPWQSFPQASEGSRNHYADDQMQVYARAYGLLCRQGGSDAAIRVPAPSEDAPDIAEIHSAVLALQCNPANTIPEKVAFLAGIHRAAAVVSLFRAARPAPVGAGMAVDVEPLSMSMCANRDYLAGWNECLAAVRAAPATPIAEKGGVMNVPRDTLEGIYEAMNHMGDILNDMDIFEDEDDKVTDAFEDIRELLAQPATEQAKPSQCVGCEGSPAPGNSPCGVCGEQAKPETGGGDWGGHALLCIGGKKGPCNCGAEQAKPETVEQAGAVDDPLLGVFTDAESLFVAMGVDGKSIAALERDAAHWRALLTAVMREIPKRHLNRNGDAPGHSHSVPGIWDSDNGDKAGKPCAWCLVWKKANDAISASATHKGEENG